MLTDRVLKWATRLLIPVGVVALELGLGVYQYTQVTWTTEGMALWCGAAMFFNYVLVMTLVVPRFQLDRR